MILSNVLPGSILMINHVTDVPESTYMIYVFSNPCIIGIKLNCIPFFLLYC